MSTRFRDQGVLTVAISTNFAPHWVQKRFVGRFSAPQWLHFLAEFVDDLVGTRARSVDFSRSSRDNRMRRLRLVPRVDPVLKNMAARPPATSHNGAMRASNCVIE